MSSSIKRWIAGMLTVAMLISLIPDTYTIAYAQELTTETSEQVEMTETATEEEKQEDATEASAGGTTEAVTEAATEMTTEIITEAVTETVIEDEQKTEEETTEQLAEEAAEETDGSKQDSMFSMNDFDDTEQEEEMNLLLDTEEYMVYSDGSWSGGTIWYVKSKSGGKHYIFCLDKGKTMYNASYTGIISSGYSGMSAFKKAVALNYFYQTNGNSWGGKKNYGPVQEVIWDEIGSDTAKKLTAYAVHAWNMTELNSKRGYGIPGAVTPVKKSETDSAADRKKMIAAVKSKKSPTKLSNAESTIALSGYSWNYFAKGGYDGGSPDISVDGIYDDEGNAVSGEASIDGSGNLKLKINPTDAQGGNIDHPLTVIMKTKFDYQGAKNIRYVETAEGKQNLTYDASFSTTGYFAMQVYVKTSGGEPSKVYINKVDEFGQFVSGCTFRLTPISGEAGLQPPVPDLTVNSQEACFEIKLPGKYQIVEVGVPDTGEYQLNPTPFEFTAERNAENKILLTGSDGLGGIVINVESFTYTCTNESTEGGAAIVKYGNVLVKYQDGKFIYEKRTLEDVGFSFYAAEDIYVNNTLIFEAGTEIKNGTVWGGKDLLGKSRHTVEISGKVVGSHYLFREFYTDAGGNLSIQGLPVGRYYTLETKFLNGFSKIQKKHFFDIEAGKTTSINGADGVINEQAPAACHVVKVDNDTEKPVGGGEFTLYANVGNQNYDGQPLFNASQTVPIVVSRDLLTGEEKVTEGIWVPIQTVITRADGMAEFEDVPAGEYLVAETKAPEGYDLAEETYVFTHTYEAEQGDGGYHFSHTFKDQKKRKYTILKNVEKAVPAEPKQQNTDVYIYEEEAKAGITFGVYTAEDIYNTLGKKVAEKDSPITTCVTDEKGKAVFSGTLFSGKYYFKELQTVDDSRYVLDETEYPFTVAAEDTDEVLNEKPIVNKLYKGSIKVIKTDGETKTLLSGVSFQLLDAEKKVLGTFVTDVNGEIHIKNLPVGTYYLQESGTQSNYYLNETMVEVTLSKENLDKVVSIDNDRMKGSIKVIKTDGKTEETLEGVEFDLLDENKQVIGSYVTDENGEIYIGGLDIGIYYLKETKALKGYKLMNDLEKVVISTDGLDKIVNVKNYKEKTRITVTTDTTITGSGGVRTGDMSPIGIIMTLFILSIMGAAILLKKREGLELKKISVKGKNFLFIFGFVAGTFTAGAIAGNAIVKAAADFKEISTVELTDAEYNGTIYTYALQKQYETKNPEEEITFDEDVNGLKLSGIDYVTLEEIPQTKILEETKEYKDLLEKDESKISKTLTLEGQTYKLEDISWSEEPNIEHVSYTKDYGYATTEPEHAATYEYTYTSPVTKKENTVTLPFVRMDKSDYSWVDGFTATVTFHNLEGEYFKLGNHEFAYNPDKLSFTESDYTELVRMLGYDTSKYRLNSASWSGKPYEGKNGQMYRNATASGQQYAASFKAVYEDDIENGKFYTAQATYKAEVEVPADEAAPTYVMQATGYYEKSGIPPVVMTVGIVVLVLLLIGILYVLTGKKKNMENSSMNE